jgi:putative intracellular protease/amidase
VAGGQGPMFTLEKAENLQAKFPGVLRDRQADPALFHGVASLCLLPMPRSSPIRPDGTWARAQKDRQVMPSRVEDEFGKFGANFVQAGLWMRFAIRDGNLITGRQNFSGAETADEVIVERGWAVIQG